MNEEGRTAVQGLRGTPVAVALCGVEGDAPCDLELDVVRPVMKPGSNLSSENKLQRS